MDFVREIESTEFSVGEVSTQLWLREYLDYLPYFKTDPKDFYAVFYNYSKLAVNRNNGKYIAWETLDGLSSRNEPPIPQFWFVTHFNRAGTWPQRVELVKILRDIAEKYQQYETFIYLENCLFIDQVRHRISGVKQYRRIW